METSSEIRHYPLIQEYWQECRQETVQFVQEEHIIWTEPAANDVITFMRLGIRDMLAGDEEGYDDEPEGNRDAIAELKTEKELKVALTLAMFLSGLREKDGSEKRAG